MVGFSLFWVVWLAARVLFHVTMRNGLGEFYNGFIVFYCGYKVPSLFKEPG